MLSTSFREVRDRFTLLMEERTNASVPMEWSDRLVGGPGNLGLFVHGCRWLTGDCDYA